jgi:hypothetical protein
MSEQTNTALTRFIIMSPVPKRERVAASTLPPIARRPVISSMMQSAGYDDAHAVLEIEFVTGTIYRYHAVPHRIWRELLEAESKGRYFDACIRDKYPTIRV